MLAEAPRPDICVDPLPIGDLVAADELARALRQLASLASGVGSIATADLAPLFRAATRLAAACEGLRAAVVLEAERRGVVADSDARDVREWVATEVHEAGAPVSPGDARSMQLLTRVAGGPDTARLVVAVTSGQLGVEAAADVAAMYQRLKPRIDLTCWDDVFDAIVAASALGIARRDWAGLEDRILAQYGSAQTFEEVEEARYQARGMTPFRRNRRGMSEARVELDPVSEAVVVAALSALSAPLPDPDTGESDPRTANQRRADALVSLAMLSTTPQATRPGSGAKSQVIVTMPYDDLLGRLAYPGHRPDRPAHAPSDRTGHTASDGSTPDQRSGPSFSGPGISEPAFSGPGISEPAFSRPAISESALRKSALREPGTGAPGSGGLGGCLREPTCEGAPSPEWSPGGSTASASGKLQNRTLPEADGASGTSATASQPQGGQGGCLHEPAGPPATQNGPQTGSQKDGPQTVPSTWQSQPPPRGSSASLGGLHGCSHGGGPAPGTTLFGQVISPHSVRMLACDAGIIPAVLGSRSEPLDVGRSARLASPAIQAALWLRDGGCSFPSCTMPARFCDAHHVIEWAWGGPTSVRTMALLCRHHHRVVHRHGYTARVTETGVRWDLTRRRPLTSSHSEVHRRAG